jgi:predicted Fe-Mo cluster-binding NifX family protein
MSKVGVMMSVDQPDGLMSSHFGKAKWFMVADTEGATPAFIRNEGLNGRCAAEIATHEGCTDVILVDIGDGALGHLQRANIRAWAAPGPVAGADALRLLAEGKLTPVPAARAAERHGGHHGGCCSGHAGGHAAGHGAGHRGCCCHS